MRGTKGPVDTYKNFFCGLPWEMLHVLVEVEKPVKEFCFSSTDRLNNEDGT